MLGFLGPAFFLFLNFARVQRWKPVCALAGADRPGDAELPAAEEASFKEAVQTLERDSVEFALVASAQSAPGPHQ